MAGHGGAALGGRKDCSPVSVGRENWKHGNVEADSLIEVGRISEMSVGVY
jgi:hypothetical protein